jgi:hypothetical protein
LWAGERLPTTPTSAVSLGLTFESFEWLGVRQQRNRRRSCNDYWNVTICLVLSAGSSDLWLFSVEILLISDHKKWHHTFSYILNPKFFPRNLMYLDQGGSVSVWRSLYPRENLCRETEGELCWCKEFSDFWSFLQQHRLDLLAPAIWQRPL